MTKSTLTHHFRVLREAGVISQEIAGTSKLNTLRREDLDARFPGLLDAVLAADAVPAVAANAGQGMMRTAGRCPRPRRSIRNCW